MQGVRETVDAEGKSTGLNPGIGFADPVLQSQAAFRAILTALSEPGTRHALDGSVATPAGIEPASAISLLTLADYETPIWLGAAARDGAASRWLRFHAGAPLVAAMAEAAFAVIGAGEPAPRLDAFSPGTDQYPDRAATVLVECASLEGGLPIELTGPGIPGTRAIAPTGLRASFWEEVAANGARYPLGVDIILVAGREIIGLPRSTQVQPVGEGR